MRYDPNREVDSKAWLELDEGVRIELALDYHKRARVELPNAKVHAVVHTVVENQAALGDEYPVAEKLRQLVGEGLSRHDAIHAIGSVLMQHVFDVMQDSAKAEGDLNEPYIRDLATLTAKKWLASGE
jgi:hypothetical protein